ncbi:MAG: hypothetical protein NTZ50_08595 [Chloroflexi bacterium]|nr:hypothetical protein [Chloroflexota bacterium]
MKTEEVPVEVQVRNAVEDWKAAIITDAELMRILASQEFWEMPVSDAAAAEAMEDDVLSGVRIHEDKGGTRRLFIFSGSSAYRAHQKITGEKELPEFLAVQASWLFQILPPDIDFLEIDPNSAYGITFDREQMEQLSTCACSVDIEQTLFDLGDDESLTSEEMDAMLSEVAEYPSYQLAVYETENGRSIALAPDENDRALAAVFTHDDCFAAFVEESGDEEVRTITLSGVELFTELRSADLTGIVFNCSGPGEPVAFALGIADVVLRSVN